MDFYSCCWLRVHVNISTVCHLCLVYDLFHRHCYVLGSNNIRSVIPPTCHLWSKCPILYDYIFCFCCFLYHCFWWNSKEERLTYIFFIIFLVSLILVTQIFSQHSVDPWFFPCTCSLLFNWEATRKNIISFKRFYFRKRRSIFLWPL